MAQKKEHKIVSATTGAEVKPGETAPKPETAHAVKPAKEVGNANGMRIGAVCLWAAAILFEVLAVLVLFGKIHLTFLPMMWQLIVLLVLDLACVIIGSQLWKRPTTSTPPRRRTPRCSGCGTTWA